jgi:hypothetical protein
MSTTPVIKTTNTNTRTSRRNKANKGQKMTLGEFNVHFETPVEPKPVEVQVETQPIAEPKPVETQPETQPVEPKPVEPKPVVNAWQERRKLAAEKALKAAEEALKAAEAAKKEAEALVVHVETIVETKATQVSKPDDEFVQVGPTGKPVRKNQPRHNGNQDKPRYQGGQKPRHQDGQKPRTAHYELTEKQKAARALKGQALEQARNQMIAECVQLIPKKDIGSIESGIKHVINYSKTLLLDITDDAIVVETGSEKFQFSRLHFLEDRTFQYKVRERFAKFFPEAWVNFFHGRKEGTFCIGLTRRHD